jgi:hypothetical protein
MYAKGVHFQKKKLCFHADKKKYVPLCNMIFFSKSMGTLFWSTRKELASIE